MPAKIAILIAQKLADERTRKIIITIVAVVLSIIFLLVAGLQAIIALFTITLSTFLTEDTSLVGQTVALMDEARDAYVDEQMAEYRQRTDRNGNEYRNVILQWENGFSNNDKEVLTIVSCYYEQDWEGLKMIGYSGRQIAQTANKKARRAAHQGGIIYLAKKAKAEKRTMLGGRPIDLAWEAEKAAWIEDDLDIEPYLAKGYNTDEGLPKLTELRLGMRMGFDESSYDDPTLPLHIIKKRRVHQLRDWAREQGLLPPMYYEDPVHGIEKNQLRELLIGIANGIMPDTYGLKLIKLHKCGPRVLREMRLCREAGMTGKEIRPYWALGVKKLQEVRAAFLAEKETDDGQ